MHWKTKHEFSSPGGVLYGCRISMSFGPVLKQTLGSPLSHKIKTCWFILFFPRFHANRVLLRLVHWAPPQKKAFFFQTCSDRGGSNRARTCRVKLWQGPNLVGVPSQDCPNKHLGSMPWLQWLEASRRPWTCRAPPSERETMTLSRELVNQRPSRPPVPTRNPRKQRRSSVTRPRAPRNLFGEACCSGPLALNKPLWIVCI